jgi:hypothetical protein
MTFSLDFKCTLVINIVLEGRIWSNYSNVYCIKFPDIAVALRSKRIINSVTNLFYVMSKLLFLLLVRLEIFNNKKVYYFVRTMCQICIVIHYHIIYRVWWVQIHLFIEGCLQMVFCPFYFLWFLKIFQRKISTLWYPDIHLVFGSFSNVFLMIIT